MKTFLHSSAWPVVNLSRVSTFLAVGIVLLGLALRLWHLDYDQRMQSHPDERSNSYYAVTIRMPEDLKNLLHPRLSHLNPFWNLRENEERHFTYGHFPLYLGVLASNMVSHASPLLAALGLPDTWVEVAADVPYSSSRFLLVGRLVITLLDALTIGLLYLSARRLYGVRPGLLAAFLWAIAVMPFKDSHFFTVDIALTTFVTLTLLGYLFLLDHPGSFRGIGLTGLGIGLSIASKFSAFPIALLCGALFWLQWRRAKSRGDAERGLVWCLTRQCLAIISIATVTFVVTSPFVFLDWEPFRFAVFEQQGNMVTGIFDWPFTRQYRGTWPYLYNIRQQLQWGLWYPLGVTVLAGTLWALLRMGRTLWTGSSTWLPRLVDGEWLIMLWIVLYFGPTGAFLAKFNRYALPMLPSVVLLGTGLVTWCCHWWTVNPSPGAALSDRVRNAVKWVGLSWGWIVVLGSIFWLGANINGIYMRNHTWLEASRWMYHNAPDNSVVFWERWDDWLPKPRSLLLPHDPTLPQKNFKAIDWSPFDDETERSLTLLKERLLEADYIIFSSRRVIAAIPRLPERYPLANRYYELLFNGDLGFEEVHQEIHFPMLWGLQFDDTLADESWRLYDHPPVRIFAKVRHLSEQELDSLLTGYVDSAQNWFLPPSPFPTSLLARLSLDDHHADSEPGRITQALRSARSQVSQFILGESQADSLDYDLAAPRASDRFRFNNFASSRAWAAALTWWAGLALMGLIAWPFCFILFARLPDAGYALARSLGWLGLAFVVWWGAHLGIPIFTVAGVWSTVLIAGVAAAFLAWHQRQAMARRLRGRWRLLLWQEIGFSLAYLMFVVVRLFNPDLWQPWTGGEKFMDLAILNGILRSPTFPPIDPHFAGKFLNYYYWGHYLVAFQTKLTGLWTEVAYNVALAALFAQVVLLSWACTFYFHMRVTTRNEEAEDDNAALSPTWRTRLIQGLWAPLLLTGIGNLDGAWQLGHLLRFRAGLDYDFWAPSRVIPHTINEFPFWTFLFGDLHAHLLVMPITLTLLCCFIFGSYYAVNKRQVVALGVVSVVVSTIGIATNLWELPLYGALHFLFWITYGRRYWSQHWAVVTVVAGMLSVLIALGALFPLWRHFEVVATGGLGWVKQGDPLFPWLRIWGLFYTVILGWLVTYLRVLWQEQPLISRQREMRDLSVLCLLVVGFCLLWHHTTLALIMPLLLITVWGLWKGRSTLGTPRSLLLGWLLLVLGIWASTQVVYVKDFLAGGNSYRMNTLFKFFLQAWVLAAVACAMLLPGLWLWIRAQWSVPVARMCAGGFGILLAASLVYPLVGTPARLTERFPSGVPPIGTLNGIDYMQTATYTWGDADSRVTMAYDRQAIDWLNTHVTTNPVILESAVLGYYREAGTRIASHTGLPGLLGMHQTEQREPHMVSQRSDALHAIWNAENTDSMYQLLIENGIGLVYAGQLEQITHPQGVQYVAELAAGGWLELVYENPGSRIYALPINMQQDFP